MVIYIYHISSIYLYLSIYLYIYIYLIDGYKYIYIYIYIYGICCHHSHHSRNTPIEATEAQMRLDQSKATSAAACSAAKQCDVTASKAEYRRSEALERPNPYGNPKNMRKILWKSWKKFMKILWKSWKSHENPMKISWNPHENLMEHCKNLNEHWILLEEIPAKIGIMGWWPSTVFKHGWNIRYTLSFSIGNLSKDRGFSIAMFGDWMVKWWFDIKAYQTSVSQWVWFSTPLLFEAGVWTRKHPYSTVSEAAEICCKMYHLSHVSHTYPIDNPLQFPCVWIQPPILHGCSTKL